MGKVEEDAIGSMMIRKANPLKLMKNEPLWN